MSWRGGPVAGPDPWAADTLEWSLPSPPPIYNFMHIPVVTGREAMWEEDALTMFVSGLDPDHPEVLVTNLFDAEPELRAPIAGPNYWPFWTGVVTTLTMVFVMFNPWPFVVGTVLAGATILGWHMGAGDEHQSAGQQSSSTTDRRKRAVEATS
jgi:cytochrome c oxidase subunit 1